MALAVSDVCSVDATQLKPRLNIASAVAHAALRDADEGRAFAAATPRFEGSDGQAQHGSNALWREKRGVGWLLWDWFGKSRLRVHVGALLVSMGNCRESSLSNETESNQAPRDFTDSAGAGEESDRLLRTGDARRGVEGLSIESMALVVQPSIQIDGQSHAFRPAIRQRGVRRAAAETTSRGHRRWCARPAARCRGRGARSGLWSPCCDGRAAAR